MSGRFMSRIRQAGTSGFGYAMYSAAEPNVTTCKSKVERSSDSASQTRRSSSTMKTIWSGGFTQRGPRDQRSGSSGTSDAADDDHRVRHMMSTTVSSAHCDPLDDGLGRYHGPIDSPPLFWSDRNCTSHPTYRVRLNWIRATDRFPARNPPWAKSNKSRTPREPTPCVAPTAPLAAHNGNRRNASLRRCERRPDHCATWTEETARITRAPCSPPHRAASTCNWRDKCPKKSTMIAAASSALRS